MAVVCGYYHTAIITADGELWTCGAGTHGQLGHADRAHQLVPKRVCRRGAGPDTCGAPVLAAAAGPRDTLVVSADGALWTWGGGGEGQLGACLSPVCRVARVSLCVRACVRASLSQWALSAVPPLRPAQDTATCQSGC